MKNRLFTLCLASLALFSLPFIACHKDAAKETTSGSSTGDNMTDQTVTASVQGRVVDETGSPMEGATVTSGTASTRTDVNGVFTFSNISMSSRFGYVKVSKSGYFDGSRSITAKTGESNYVSIQMIPRTETSSFAAASGGLVTIGTGNSATFTASSVVTASTNAAYMGTVHVFTKYIDPTDSTMFQYMSGDLRGIDTAGKEAALQSFGMLLVELQGDAGEKLQLASGKTAKLTWTIPSKLLASAPATIPLWYFNDSTGKWIEQGTATKAGNTYIGTVSHFTTWNVDTELPTVSFSIRLVDKSGNPLPNLDVVMSVNGTYIGSGYTDSAGYRDGLIVKGATVYMMVWDGCHNTLAAETIGPLVADANLGTIVVTLTNDNVVVRGTVVDCSGSPIDSGAVWVKFASLTYGALVRNGVFSVSVTKCYSNGSTTATVIAADRITLQESQPTTISVQADTVDAGQLTACGITASQYILFNIGGSSYQLLAPGDDIYYGLGYNSSVLYITGYNSSSANFTMTSPALSGIGNVTGDSLQIGLFSNNGELLYGGAHPIINVTAFGAVNGYVQGTFSGSVQSFDTNDGTQIPVTGSFKTIRAQ